MWRAMSSLLVLRDQANAIAPNRSRASDGLVGDEDHQGTNSDHNPHYVPGVGSEIVTALDLTHDPAHGFDSYDFAEVLRTHRDKRIKYVISNHRIFSSYASGSRPAWAWGPYSGSDPHTNHVHISVLDAPISDTRTPWNLTGFGDDDMEQTDKLAFPTSNANRKVGQVFADLSNLRDWLYGLPSVAGFNPPPAGSRAQLIVENAQRGPVVAGPVDPEALKAVLLDPEVLAALAKAVNDDAAARLAR
jgi:hypothetical protein